MLRRFIPPIKLVVHSFAGTKISATMILDGNRYYPEER